jgi:aryl-alcohol dehydrogenase-like predicted oxidoreductase
MNVIQDSPEVLAVCDAHHLTAIIRGPLGMGLLTGKYDKNARWASNDVRTAGWFQDHWFDSILDHLPHIREILASEGRTLAQGALAWLWARSPHTLPIPGVRTIAQVEENAGAMRFGPLSSAQMQQIEALLGRSEATSARS